MVATVSYQVESTVGEKPSIGTAFNVFVGLCLGIVAVALAFPSTAPWLFGAVVGTGLFAWAAVTGLRQ